jgi:acetolactate decarboxylase
MIVFDGSIYQAAFDGSLNLMPPSTGTPFMAVTRFEPDRVLDVPAPLGYPAFKQWLEDQLPSRNIAFAVQVDGRFANIRFRSIARQEKPFPPLVEVTRRQAVFERQGVAGTLIGFWCPAFARGVNVPGLHLHFLSADRRRGGHVLDFALEAGTARLDDTNGWSIRLPTVPAYLKAVLSGDRNGELHAVEQGNAGPGAGER